MFAFAPSAVRGELLDERMHRELGNSLSHLAEAATSLPVIATALMSEADRLDRGHKVQPHYFKTYFEIAEALMSDDPESAAPQCASLSLIPDREHVRRIFAYGAGQADELEAALERDGNMALAPVAENTAGDFRSLLDQGFDMMRSAVPELHGEIDAIVRQVLLAHAPPEARFEFDGASHYQFWGLLVLNPKHHKTPLACVEVLAHEAAHSLLFGLTVDEPLVFNPDEELYVSPLRPDPRPMDGIYHATFVSARMAWAMEQMAQTLTGMEREQAQKAAAVDRENFSKGLGTVKSDGYLSETGAAIMAGAEEAMRTA